jgi:hypothetical protein
MRGGYGCCSKNPGKQLLRNETIASLYDGAIAMEALARYIIQIGLIFL